MLLNRATMKRASQTIDTSNLEPRTLPLAPGTSSIAHALTFTVHSATRRIPHAEIARRASVSALATIPSLSSSLARPRYSQHPTLHLLRIPQRPQSPPKFHLCPPTTRPRSRKATRLPLLPATHLLLLLQVLPTTPRPSTPLTLPSLPPLLQECTQANLSTTACQWILT